MGTLKMVEFFFLDFWRRGGGRGGDRGRMGEEGKGEGGKGESIRGEAR